MLEQTADTLRTAHRVITEDHLDMDHLFVLLLLCSSGLQAEGELTESVRLVGGNSRCAGTLEVKHLGEWRPVEGHSAWTLKTVDFVCRKLACGSAVSCASSISHSTLLTLNCSDSVRLVNGTSLCSGRLEGALYGEVEAPMGTKEFQCGGTESALLECGSSGSDRNTCSPGKAVGLTCPEPVRLVGGASRCTGTLELKYKGEWRPVNDYYSVLTLKEAAAACRELDCGSALSVGKRESSRRPVWLVLSSCVHSGSAQRGCATSFYSSFIQDLICSDLLLQPDISVSSSIVWVSEEAQQQGFQVFWHSNFTISCSIQPQYPGGSFQLTFTSSNSTHNYTQPAVNHSAHFLFLAAKPTHQGSYSCVYHLYVFSHNFFSESRLLSLSVIDPSDSTPFIIRVVVLLLTLLLVNIALYFYYKDSRGRSRKDRRTWSWTIITWVSLQPKEGRRKRKQLGEQSSTSTQT
ncbi:hypothetical protein PFLUV_G00185160 [Perca fluviatilis]|uniref:SRCR domain-containing protein n=1 Tax=Perca fluviatilis TaxID=8168 RepID=A0A6A5DXG4_PERFL|nr:hypothetical protein PFLUV_G00185160 [Perca fluviatilis]